jgi:hypothetical protein
MHTTAARLKRGKAVVASGFGESSGARRHLLLSGTSTLARGRYTLTLGAHGRATTLTVR